VIGKTHRRFWKAFEKLPAAIQNLAREKCALWKRDPFHPSLHFEERRNGICVVRIGTGYRALGLREGDTCLALTIQTSRLFPRLVSAPGDRQSHHRRLILFGSSRPMNDRVVEGTRLHPTKSPNDTSRRSRGAPRMEIALPSYACCLEFIRFASV
jgi:hypothetical protein